MHHSRECRKRIETEMSKDELLSKRLADIEDRKRDISRDKSRRLTRKESTLRWLPRVQRPLQAMNLGLQSIP